jgi:gamma-glutamylcyclotransferase (GGCT)/AIG2-like uncharacterized protein YtfP
MQHLFAYGSLMCEDIMLEASGYAPSSRPATLKEYRRYTIKGERYPGIAPFAGSTVEGIVYLDVPESAWVRLDKFEGDLYMRKSVYIEVNKEFLPAATYVVKPEFYDFLDDVEWSFSDFLRNTKADFLKSYKGFFSQ